MSLYSEYAGNLARIEEGKGAALAEAQRQQGNIWGNALNNLGQLVANVPAQQAEQQKQKLQAQLTGIELQKATREQQQQTALQGILQKHNGDFESALPEINAVDPTLGMEIGVRLNQSKSAQIDYQQRQIKAQRDQVDWLHEQIGSVTDPASYAQALHTIAGVYGPDAVKNLPPEYDPKVVAAHNQAALTAKERLDQQMKLADQQRANLKLQLDAANMQADNQRQDAARIETARHNRTDEGIAATREKREAGQAAAQNAPLELTPEGLDAAALNYAKTGQLPPLGMGDKVTRKQIINRAAEIANGSGAAPRTDLDLASNRAGFAANEGSLKALQKSRDAISAFENTALKNIDIFLNTAGKVVDTGSPLINAPARSLAGKVLGSPDQAAYDAARQVALNEVAKITSNPGLSGQLSDNARKEIENFNPNTATLKQSVAVMRVLKQDMANRAASYDQQIADIQGRIKGGGASTAPATAPAATGGVPSYQDYLRSRGK